MAFKHHVLTLCIFSSGLIQLAHYTSDSGEYSDYNGYISHVRLYNRVLTPAELVSNLAGTEPTDGAILLWQNYQIEAGCQFLSPSTKTAGESTVITGRKYR